MLNIINFNSILVFFVVFLLVPTKKFDFILNYYLFIFLNYILKLWLKILVS